MIYSIPYLLYTFMLFCLCFLSKNDIVSNGSIGYNKNLVVVIVLSYLLFWGFRGFISTDCSSYYPAYNKMPPLFFGGLNYLEENPYMWEKGFLFFSLFIKTFTGNYFIYQFINTVIDICILCAAIRYFFPKNKDFILAFFFFYIFQGYMIQINLLRNIKAIYIFFYSLRFIEEKKVIKYFLCNLIGFAFHSTALLFLPLYFVLRINFSKKILITLFIIGNIIFLARIELSRSIIELIFNFLPNSSRFKTYIIMYVFERVSESYGISIGYLERFASTIFVFLCFDKFDSKKQKLILNVFFIYQFIFLFFADINYIPQRICVLFVFAYWIVYPMLYKYISVSFKKAFLLLFLIYSCLKVYGDTHIELLSYTNYLFSPIKFRTFDEYSSVFKNWSETYKSK